MTDEKIAGWALIGIGITLLLVAAYALGRAQNAQEGWKIVTVTRSAGYCKPPKMPSRATRGYSL